VDEACRGHVIAPQGIAPVNSFCKRRRRRLLHLQFPVGIGGRDWQIERERENREQPQIEPTEFDFEQ